MKEPSKVVPITKNSIGPIEPGIPVRRGNSGVKDSSKYPFPEMRVGQSFTVPIEWRKMIATAASRYGIRHNKQFVTRQEGDRLRIWRVK